MTDELKERVKLPLHPVTCSVEGWSTDEARVLREFAQAVARDCAAVCDNAWQIDGSFSAKEFGDLVRARYGLATPSQAG